LDLSITKFCTNLRKLRTGFNDCEILKIIFENCQYLESFVFSCVGKEVLEIIAKYSPKNFHELKFCPDKLSSEELESFFISWKNRTSHKPLSLTIFGETRSESMKTIERYIKLGVVKEFKSKYGPVQND
jgi:hypothetical protein